VAPGCDDHHSFRVAAVQNPKAGKSRNFSGVQIFSVRRSPPIANVDAI
jgi:hypothetical protein